MAAFVAEPVMGTGGAVIPPKTYFEKIQAVLAKYDVLMVADEVITGFFRTGNRFASETFGIRPDIMTLAKQLSSAYLPISAVLLNDKVYEEPEIDMLFDRWALALDDTLAHVRGEGWM